ncbi:IS110 family transposase [Cryobacterium sp. Y50]|uniref:IS110 family transposase n=1 Tax=Cryobacterium sp. Y50 TaxID=2048286 RepID=UPI000CE447D3|nr:IS110 family transposase [Cryobacterium sp. Y50]
MVSQVFGHVVGVDTHAKTHTLVAIDQLGARHGIAQTFPTNPAGLKRAQAWIERETTVPVLVAMEGTGSYGAQFCDLLVASGVRVSETKPPKRGVRRAGKFDPIDAEHAARYALALPVEQLITPRDHAGDHAALTVLLTARAALKRSRGSSINRLTALLRGFGFGLDVRTSLTDEQISQVAAWRAHRTDDAGMVTIRAEATREAQDILRRSVELKANEKGLLKHVSALAPRLLAEHGVGPYVAAQLVVSWSHKGRIRSEAAFARFAGAAPIPASSGNTTRHRLHRGGDRQLSNALYVTAFYRYHHDPVAYFAKKTQEGQTRKEIIRSLKLLHRPPPLSRPGEPHRLASDTRHPSPEPPTQRVEPSSTAHPATLTRPKTISELGHQSGKDLRPYA